MINTEDIRMECLRLALQTTKIDNEALKTAKAFLEFVETGDVAAEMRHEAPTRVEDTAAMQAAINERWRERIGEVD